MDDDAAHRVSVIIIFLNPGRYLAEAIESVVAQSLQDWELILVDDGSTDESTAIAQQWVRRLPGQVRYLEHAGHVNRGMSASRNLGLREARGRYIAFLDADDTYLPERLAAHAAVLDAMPGIDMVQSDQIYWYCWQDRRGRLQQEECRRPPLFVGDAILRAPQGLYMLFGVPDAFTAPCSFTIRRAAALELGGFEDEFRSLYEDQVFLTKVYAHKTVYALQAHLARYRLHSSGTVATAVAQAGGRQGALFAAGRRLRDWQTDYLARLLAQDDLVRELLAGHRHRAQQAGTDRVQRAKSTSRRAMHGLVQRLLPHSVYRTVLQRRQQWSADRCHRQHAAMCERLSSARLAHPATVTAPAVAGRPRVAVITIFRNEERFLRDAVESVLAQTFTDWELLLVDDGSTDASGAIAAEYAAQRPTKIRCLQHPGHENRGMSASRNLGIAAARADYIAFLDGDDVYLPQRLQRHVELLDAMPAIDMVQSDLVHWHSWQSKHRRGDEDYVRPCVCFTDRVLAAPLALRTVIEVPELYSGICSLTVRRATAVELGGFEESFRGLYEDQVFLTKVYAEKTVYVLEDYLARYRIHPDSMVERMRRTTRRQGELAEQLGAEFAAWRLRYLESRPDPAGRLASLVSDLRERQSAGQGSRIASTLTAAKRALRRVLQRSLPPGAYRIAQARARRRASELTIERYRQLCVRLGDLR